MTKEFKTLSDKIMPEGVVCGGHSYVDIKHVKEFIKKYNDDIEDRVIIKMKDVPEQMIGIDLTWLDKEIKKIKDRLSNKLKERAGSNLIELKGGKRE